MQEELKTALKDAAKKLFNTEIEPEITRTDEQFGDYATNAALQLAKKAAATPQQIAKQLVDELQNLPGFETPTIAGPGFINFTLTDEALQKAAHSATDLPKPNAGQEILVEFGDPNPFKEMHIGHVYSYITGDAISSLLEASGAKARRLSYHGDIGLHVAKAIWAISKNEKIMSGESELSKAMLVDFGLFYAEGAKAYEQDEKAKDEISEINKKIYDKADPQINELYEWGKDKSFAYFDEILRDLGIHASERFLESQSAKKGEELVEQNVDKVFEKSEGAIVFKGEKAGLHTRVFVTSNGLPTYETKDLGLAELKKEKFPGAKQSLIVTAHEQAGYFKVMLAALAEIDEPTAKMTKHLYHGFVSLSSGKMSSRTGEVYGAVDLIGDVDEATQKAFGQKSSSTRNSAIKYGFLKHRLGSDIVYDVTESVALEGNSGPYLQYA
ncbi:MAG: arginine--tRNA ligase, partial [Candidatus Saccharimonadales bacterium]